jgi:hypothetical protein
MNEVASPEAPQAPDIFVGMRDVREMIDIGYFAVRTYVDRSQKQLHFSEVLPLAERVADDGQLNRSLNAVAADVIKHCEAVVPGSSERVSPSIDSFFKSRALEPLTEEQNDPFVREARRSLTTRQFHMLQREFPEVYG